MAICYIKKKNPKSPKNSFKLFLDTTCNWFGQGKLEISIKKGFNKMTEPPKKHKGYL
jgi:hypothetical protein